MSQEPKKVAGRFFLEGDLSGQAMELPDREAAHALKSRRIKPGTMVEVFNGRGETRSGLLEVGRSKKVEIKFLEAVKRLDAPAHKLCLAVSPPKGDRMSFLVEKLSELGADVLIPTVFRRSLDAGVRSYTAKISRWRRTAVESAKQCGRNFLLALEEPKTADLLLKELAPYDLKILLTLEKDLERFAKCLERQGEPPRRALILVGPEGGFTAEETAGALEAGMIPASLGEGILRVETAALAAAAVFRSRWP